jgi:hypothetical protein
MGRRASAGEGRRLGGGSIQLHLSAGGGWTVARGVAATDRSGGGGSGGRWKTAGPKLLLGLKSKRVKEKLILIDFWIKIGIEID